MSDESSPGLTNFSMVCENVQTTLGPLGANKMILTQEGTVTTTTSGSQVLDELDLNDPAFTLLEQAATDFSSRYGDGSTAVVTLTGALLAEAESLIEKGLHPTVIENGYQEAMEIAANEVSFRERPLRDVSLEAVIRTALTGTRDPTVRSTVADHIGTAIRTITEAPSENPSQQQIKVVPRLGGSLSETELVRGVVLNTGPEIRSMPRRLEEAQIALLSTTVDVPYLSTETSTDSNRTVTANSIEDRIALGEAERNAFAEQLQQATDAGCNAIITTRAINERVTQQLANNGIVGISQVDDDDIAQIARATGATIVPTMSELDTPQLGTGTLEIHRHAGRDMTFIESESGDPVFTLFVRAPDPRSVEAFQRSVEHSIHSGLSAQESGTVVPGGGAIEMSAIHAIRADARSFDDRKQLAVEAFGDALSVIPQTLAMNSGLDRHTSLARLHVSHNEGRNSVGVDATRRVLDDVFKEQPIVEPPQLKRAAWSAATDLTTKLIRIDEQISANDLEPEEPEG